MTITCPHRSKSTGMLAALIIMLGSIFFSLSAQETTAGLQGTIKDNSGAVISGASVSATSSTLVGEKETTTDSRGYYRFANLPPGTYKLTVKAAGFQTLEKEGIILEVGHLPSLDFTVAVGSVSTVVQVTGAS